MAEGYFERIQREESEARMNAAIRELHRRLDAKEFPENEGTLAAFAAGFYTAYAYRAETHLANTKGSTAHMGAFAFGLVGLMLTSFYLLALYLALPMNDNAPWMFAIGLVLCGGAVWFLRRAHRQSREAKAAHRAKWGPQESAHA